MLLKQAIRLEKTERILEVLQGNRVRREAKKTCHPRSRPTIVIPANAGTQ